MSAVPTELFLDRLLRWLDTSLWLNYLGFACLGAWVFAVSTTPIYADLAGVARAAPIHAYSGTLEFAEFRRRNARLRLSSGEIVALSCGYAGVDYCFRDTATPVPVQLRGFKFRGQVVVLSAVSANGVTLVSEAGQRAAIAETSRQAADPANGATAQALIGGTLGLIMAAVRHVLFVRRARKALANGGRRGA